MSTPAERQVHALLKKDGATLVRSGKHLVYRLSNNQMFTMAKTPSDHRAAQNELSDLRRVLGIERQTKPKRITVKKVTRQPKRKQPSQLTVVSSRSEDIDRRNLNSLAALGSVIHKPEQSKRAYEKRNEQKSAAYTYPPEVLETANTILRETGKEAMDTFLRDQREKTVPVTRQKRHIKDTEMPSVLELRATAAREMKAQLDAKVTGCQKRIEEAKAAIAAAERETTEAQEQIVKLSEFLSWFDNALQQSEQVEPILSSLQRLTIVEAKVKQRQQDDKPKSARLPMWELTKELWNREGNVNAQDILEFLERKNITVDKRNIHTALSNWKNSGKIVPAEGRPGEYNLAGRSVRMPVTTSVTAATAATA